MEGRMGGPNDIEPDDIRSIPTFRAAYSDRTALLMARLAHRAYDGFDKGDDAFKKFQAGFSDLGLAECEKLIDATSGTAGFVIAGPELIAVVFRGTQDLLDWRTNMSVAWAVLQGGVRVHSGFVLAYRTIRDPLFATIVRLVQAKQRPVYITGHSLGGALAVMATAELSNHDDASVRDSIAACYTFGCPKAGDRSFDQYVKVPLYRITNGVDLVPAVPPVFSGYKHVGDTRYFGKIGIPPLRRAPNILQKLWRTSWGLLQFLRTRKLLNIADHSMNVYVQKLAEWAEVTRKEAQKRREATADPSLKS
jgi:triacylglycerol lipase